ncbi:response regulator transcription factor [Congregibacter brevis]|uniref:Response regulator transcription factor n=1 Tax=Congregibacter brevis TaxID=3081201 RepID=A0ABZ0IHG7_9GAMM|nr:response regulator transcription factor [Congregibacter sp. IMCC45268]
MRHSLGTRAANRPLRELFRLDSELSMTEAPLSTVNASRRDVASTIPLPRILVVEDDEDIARLIVMHLEDLNAELTHCDRGDDALQLARSESWDLMVLDLRLPGVGGLDICRQLREQGSITPILMLTAKSSELDRVLGLELGADDYLTKPFSPLELTARAKALLRRAGMTRQQTRSQENNAEDPPLELGPFSICDRTHRVTMNGDRIELTSREFDLLLHFAKQPGRVFRRSELLDEVWGYGHDGYEHTVNTHINRLRGKIEEDPGNPLYVSTVWGVGYRFQVEP